MAHIYMLACCSNSRYIISDLELKIMPSSNKARAVFDSGKTTSFHIKSVVACQQSSKSSSIFKLVVQHDNRNKRYDFEAESSKLAGMSFIFYLFVRALMSSVSVGI
jgi:target of rapamycin complex 2 subunit MAPKAP1